MPVTRSLTRSQQISEEELLLHEEEADAHPDTLDDLAELAASDFPDNDASPAAIRAAEITRAHITDATRAGHAR